MVVSDVDQGSYFRLKRSRFQAGFVGRPAVHILPTWSGERSEGPYLGRQCGRVDLELLSCVGHICHFT